MIKRQGEERVGHGGAEERTLGVRKRQEDAGEDQYSRVMIGSLRGSGGTTLSDIRDQSVRVCTSVGLLSYYLMRLPGRGRGRGFPAARKRVMMIRFWAMWSAAC